MRLTKRHWTVALVSAAALHVGGAAVYFWQSDPPGAVASGLGGIEVSLGPAGGAPGTEAVPVTETTEVEEVTPEEVPPETVPPETETVEQPEMIEPVEADTVPEEEPEVLETVEPDPVEVETPEEPLPTEPVEVEAVEAEAIETVEAKPVVRPPPPQRKPTPPRPPKPQPVKAPTPAPQPAPQAVPEPPKQVASVAGAAGKSGATDSREAGSAESQSGGGLPGDTVDYLSTLQAWLEKHKQYPSSARRRRQEGTALLYFVMDRDGQVLDFSIRQSSGHSSLDQEVAAMIERAQPLPRMPDSMTQNRQEFVIPVQFFLR